MLDNAAVQDSLDPSYLISCENVWKIFRSGENIVKALQNVTLNVMKQEMVCVRGPSGSGKSTLLNILGALDYATKGVVKGLGLNYKELSLHELSKFRRKYIGFVFQELSLIPHLNALENVMIPCLFDGISRNELQEKGSELLKSVETFHRASHFPRELSSGERQRVAIARALMRNPQIILADEPTANLDNVNVEKVINIFRRLCSEGTTVIVATHDDRIQKAADRTIRINDGIIIHQALTRNMTDQFIAGNESQRV